MRRSWLAAKGEGPPTAGAPISSRRLHADDAAARFGPRVAGHGDRPKRRERVGPLDHAASCETPPSTSVHWMAPKAKRPLPSAAGLPSARRAEGAVRNVKSPWAYGA